MNAYLLLGKLKKEYRLFGYDKEFYHSICTSKNRAKLNAQRFEKKHPEYKIEIIRVNENEI